MSSCGAIERRCLDTSPRTYPARCPWLHAIRFGRTIGRLACDTLAPPRGVTRRVKVRAFPLPLERL